MTTNLKWTKERCLQEAKKYKTRTEYYKNCRGAYNAAQRNGWLDECCSHMKCIRKPKAYWTKEKCHEEAKKYKTRSEFHKYAHNAYDSAWQNVWLDDICGHMNKSNKKPKGYWTKDKCKDEVLKYRTISEFAKNSIGAYKAARKNNWLNEIRKHML